MNNQKENNIYYEGKQTSNLIVPRDCGYQQHIQHEHIANHVQQSLVRSPHPRHRVAVRYDECSTTRAFGTKVLN